MPSNVNWKVHIILMFYCLLPLNTASAQSNQELEAKCLTNMHQLTFSSMGFEKAGEAYFSPDGKTILFQAVPTGEKEYQIYSMNLEEGTPRMVSTGKGACTCAYFRPDGQRIIFASSHAGPESVKEEPADGRYKWDLTPYMNIYDANPDGSDLQALTSGPAYHAECAYAPSGDNIVYASNEDGAMNLYTMDADGSNVRQITHTDYCYNGGPFFSPDGGQIIFRADRDRPDYLQIYVINSDGTIERQLTTNEAVNWAPYWHPEGKVIAYATSLHGHRQYEIYLMNVETQAQYRLTYNPTFDGLAVFSNDGKQLMWTSKRSSDNTCQIFIADFTMPSELISKE